MFLAVSEGVTDKYAQVSHVSVHAIDCAVVAISTLPATVVLAFGCVLPDDIADQEPHIYW